MVRIDVKKDYGKGTDGKMLTACPECGQKLTDITYVDGTVVLRVLCRRCKSFINVTISGNS